MPFTGVCPANGLNAPAIAATTARPSAMPLKSTHRGSRRQTTANSQHRGDDQAERGQRGVAVNDLLDRVGHGRTFDLEDAG